MRWRGARRRSAAVDGSLGQAANNRPLPSRTTPGQQQSPGPDRLTGLWFVLPLPASPNCSPATADDILPAATHSSAERPWACLTGRAPHQRSCSCARPAFPVGNAECPRLPGRLVCSTTCIPGHFPHRFWLITACALHSLMAVCEFFDDGACAGAMSVPAALVSIGELRKARTHRPVLSAPNSICTRLSNRCGEPM